MTPPIPFPDPCERHSNVTWLARVPDDSWRDGQECFGCFIEAKHKELLKSEGWVKLREAADQAHRRWKHGGDYRELVARVHELGEAIRSLKAQP